MHFDDLIQEIFDEESLKGRLDREILYLQWD